MTRWILSPIILAVLGVGIGFGTTMLVLLLGLSGRVFEWRTLIPLTAATALSAHRRARRRRARGHGAIALVFPSAALGGVLLGDVLATVRSSRAPRRIASCQEIVPSIPET